MMTREAASALPAGQDCHRFSVSSSPPVEAAIDAVLIHGVDAPLSKEEVSGTEDIVSHQIESCSNITQNVNGGVQKERALPQEAGSAVGKDKEECGTLPAIQIKHEEKRALPSEVQSDEEQQDPPPSVQINRPTGQNEKRESSGPLRVCIKLPSENQETADGRQEDKQTEESAGGSETAKETDENEAEVDEEEEDEFDLDKQRRRKSYRQFFGLEDPEEDDEDEEEDEFDLDKQRRRKSYLEYFGLVDPAEGNGQGGAGGLSVVTSPGAHRKSSLISIMFDAGRVTHWSDVYQKDKQAQPVVFKRMNLRFEVVNTEGGPPGVLGTREAWLAVYDHGKHRRLLEDLQISLPVRARHCLYKRTNTKEAGGQHACGLLSSLSLCIHVNREVARGRHVPRKN